MQTIQKIRECELSLGIITPSLSIAEISEQFGAKFCYIDKGIDLNIALGQAVGELPSSQPILILMPDLPFLSVTFLQSLVNYTNKTDLLLIPSISDDGSKKGTAMLYMGHPNLIPFYFGENSNKRFIKEAKAKNIEFLVKEYDPQARDLDTVGDLRYLQDNLEQTDTSESYEKILKFLISENRV
jgi:2-phospho-L-lactate guanylyltransferase (CobY/MobA/RfbA family)